MPSLQRELQSVPLSHRVSEMAKIGEIWEFLCSNRWEASLSTAEVSTVKRFRGLWPWDFFLISDIADLRPCVYQVSRVQAQCIPHYQRGATNIHRGGSRFCALSKQEKDRWFTSSQVHMNYSFKYIWWSNFFSSIWCFSISNLQMFEAGTAQNLGVKFESPLRIKLPSFLGGICKLTWGIFANIWGFPNLTKTPFLKNRYDSLVHGRQTQC